MLCVLVHVNLVTGPARISAPLTPTCISCESSGDKPWYLHRGKLPLHYISNLPLGVTNEGREAIKQFLAPLPGTQRRYKYASPDNSQFLVPLPDSCIQNRGVARYLLSLLFSLVSLPFSFYFCVPYKKYQKYILPFLCGQLC